MRVNIIGAGKTGKTLGRLLVLHKAATIGCLYNTSEATNQEALSFVEQGTGITELSHLQNADITFITTPDDCIEETCNYLVKLNLIQANSIIAHVSGTKTSHTLKAARLQNCALVSAHPLKSFAQPKLAVTNFSGTYCALEGDESAVNVMRELFQKIGAQPFQISQHKKAVYHAAGVFASNYLITLFDTAQQCLIESGIAREVAWEITMSLMQGTLSNLNTLQSTEKSLTGPLKRGDIDTLNSHLEQLSGQTKLLYQTLGQKSLELTLHDKILHEKIQETLSE